MSDIKILITEDEAIVARDIANRLRKMGYEVTDIVDSGEAAIASVLAIQPDLILMDIMLHGDMDGVETAERISEIANIPVVYLTAYADHETLKRAKATIPFGYILKPFKGKELQATIEIALSRHQAEQAMQKAIESQRRENQAMSERKSQYLSIVSHEFRTPLSVIKLAADVLQYQSHNLTEEKKLKRFKSIQLAVNNIDQLLKDVLAMDQTEASSLKFSPTPFDLVSFCSDLVETFQASTIKHVLVFKNEGFDAGKFPLFDERLVWHTLNNLISNAIKYSPQGGTISLTLICQEDRVQIHLQDQGIGIPSQDLHGLFEPFQRASNVGKIPGTGLGLAIAKQCVDLHGGDVLVESEEGKGTKLMITLPL
jgi:signal transduction histidine kinase